MTGQPPFEPAGRLIPKVYHDQLVAKAPLIFEHTLTEEQLVATENVRVALRNLEKAIWAEDARMRSEVLPSPPVGWEWRSDLVTSDDLVSAGVKIRLQYHLEEVRREGA